MIVNQVIKNRIDLIKNGQMPDGYKKTDLGVFPMDWESVTIKKLANVVSGGTPPTSHSECWNGDIYWFTPAEIGRRFVNKSMRTITKKGLKYSNLIPKGNILLTSRATLGEMSINNIPCCTNQGFQSLVFEDLALRDYVYQLRFIIKQAMLRIAVGSTFMEVSKQKLKKVELTLPQNKVELERIAKILMKWDEAIELQELYIDKLKVRKKALMQKLLTSNIDWVACPLGKFITLKNGYAFKSMTYLREGKYKIITIKNVQHGLLDLSEVNYIDSLPTNIKNHQVLNNGDIIISLTGNVGRTCYVNSENCLLNQRVAKVETKNTIAQFIFAIFQTEKFLYYMQNIAQGCAQANLSNKDVENYIATFPINSKGLIDLEKEKDIANVLINADIEITFHQQKLEKIKEQRKALMQLLLTGIVRVK